MVVWIFAGGGESEVEGLKPFFESNYPQHRFERKLPERRKPGPKPTGQPGYGHTGRSLSAQIVKRLRASLSRGDICDLILVIDDLDCQEINQKIQYFTKAVDTISYVTPIPLHIGLASPEIEAWLIADWDNTFARDVDFRHCHNAMRHWLRTQQNVKFDNPEDFSEFSPDKNACAEKLSDAIIESTRKQDISAKREYSKAIHTPRLLKQADSQVISNKCPLYRQIHIKLSSI
ncbi:MAG: DUF4276 family protein [Caldilineaceae bacterium]|nr:DUF4276 family protein [Caldilineaceae bacterium]MCB0097786.1 DUF4276 family protein [Caldilineaceae bacterium]